MVTSIRERERLATGLRGECFCCGESAEMRITLYCHSSPRKFVLACERCSKDAHIVIDELSERY